LFSFFCLLLISCSESIDDFTPDSILLELASDPASEAVFATMSIQLKQSGGFDRVLALLNELVEDGRKQLHTANKLWRASHASCEVSEMKLKERQEFYETRANALVDAFNMAEEEKAKAMDTIQSRRKSSDIYGKILKAEQDRHAAEEKVLKGRVSVLADAITNTNAAVTAVQNWTPDTKPAFIQKHLEDVAASYLETHSYKVMIPESFVELGATDLQVRQRILEWLGILRITFQEASNNWTEVLAGRKKLWDNIEVELGAGAKDLNDDANTLTAAIKFIDDNRKNLQDARDLFQKLVKDNGDLIVSSKKYCDVEKQNYTSVKDTLEKQLKLFRDIRAYFKNNYSKINKFVKTKYNEPRK